MAIIDKVKVGTTTYNIRDTQLTGAAMELTDTEKAQARENLNAAPESGVVPGVFTDTGLVFDVANISKNKMVAKNGSQTSQNGRACTNYLNGSKPTTAISINAEGFLYRIYWFTAVGTSYFDGYDETYYPCDGRLHAISRPDCAFRINFYHDPIDTVAFTDAECATLAAAIKRYDYRAKHLSGAIATVNSGTAEQDYSDGSLLVNNDKLLIATQAIESGDTLTTGSNVTETTVGDELELLGSLAPQQTISWDEVAVKGDGRVIGWRLGFYNDQNEIVTNTTSSVCYWTYLTYNHYAFNRAECKYMWMTAPAGTEGRIKAFTSGDSGQTYTQMQQNITFTGTYRLKMEPDTRYRIYITGLSDAATWLTEANVRTIIVRWAARDDAHKPSPCHQSQNLFFTVDVERPVVFGDTTAETETEQVQCVLRMPATYTMYGKPTRMVFMAHGAHGFLDKATNDWYSAGWLALCTDLLDAGYGVFDCNTLPGTNDEWVTETEVDENWVGFGTGSPLYTQVVKKAYDYIQEKYNVYPEIFVHGTSMGGTGATAFAHAYPQLVLAESSFAGRDMLLYLKNLKQYIDDGTSDVPMDDGRFATAWGYASISALIADKFSHIDGTCPSLTMTKVKADGTIETPPDRESDFSDWLDWFWDIYGEDRGTDKATEKALDVGNWLAWRRVPYKSWNSWDDNLHSTKLEEFLRKAYTNTGCCYNIVEYDGYTHSDVSYGQSDDIAAEKLPDQLIAWYKRWE